MENRTTVLSGPQQAALDAKKVRWCAPSRASKRWPHELRAQVELAASDERYVRAHPEVSAMVSKFLDHCIRSRPESVREAAVAFFSDVEAVRGLVK